MSQKILTLFAMIGIFTVLLIFISYTSSSDSANENPFEVGKVYNYYTSSDYVKDTRKIEEIRGNWVRIGEDSWLNTNQVVHYREISRK